jgi:hypothetical protein
MSGAQTSTFAPPNVLLNTLSGAQTAEVQQNQLMNQGRQLDLSNANMEQVSRVAAALLNEPDPAKRAELYPRYVGSLQSQGYAMHAPATLPDEGTLQMLARQGTPSQTQAEWLANIQANKQYSSATGTQPPAQGSTGTGSTAPAGAGGGSAGPSFAGGIAGFESGGVSNPPENPRWPVAKGGPAGPHQFIASTWNSFAQANPDLFKGMTPDQILAARTDTTPVGPNGEDRSTLATNWYAGENAKVLQASNIAPTPANLGIAHALGAGGATKVLSAPDNTPLSQVIPETIPQNPQYGRMTVGDLKQQYSRLGPVGGTGTATATATPATAPAGGVAARTGGTDTAGPAAGATPPPAPATTAAAPPAAATVAPAQPAPTAAPAGSPAPPQLQPMNANGLTAQQQAQIDAVASTGRMTVQQRMAAEQGFRNQNIQLQQKQFSDWIQVQQLQTSQGQLSVAQQNSALEYWKVAHPDAKVTMTGGEIITQDPRTGQEIAPRIQVTPQRADTAAMAIVSRLGPKVANGTATPEEQAQYAVAVDSYRQPVLRENPVSKETVRVNTRELPAGFPEPPSLGGGGAPGGAGTGTPGGSNVVMPGLSPAQQQVERDPAAYKVSESQYERDSKEIAAIGDAGRQSQADQVRVKEMQDVLQKFNSGRGTEAATAAAAWFNSWAPAALTGWQKEAANLSGSQAAEAFSKLALVGAGTQERGVLGARGGYQAIKLFKEANPNINLQDATNKSILDMQLISNQANADYSQAALSHFADNEKRFATTHQYDSLAQFDRNWNGQRNPQVYAAAMGAIAGQPPSQWTKGLSDDEYARALQIVQRAKPSAVVQTKSGPYSMQPNAVTTGTSTAPGTKVIRFDHNGNQIQ